MVPVGFAWLVLGELLGWRMGEGWREAVFRIVRQTGFGWVMLADEVGCLQSWWNGSKVFHVLFHRRVRKVSERSHFHVLCVFSFFSRQTVLFHTDRRSTLWEMLPLHIIFLEVSNGSAGSAKNCDQSR